MPRFTVVIPTYNRAEALRHTLRSVVDQSFHDFEVVIVDDGSTDNTKAVVEQFADSRIRYFWTNNSGGPATPRNVGVSEATGEWIAFLDSDDLWSPLKLEVIDRSIGQDSNVDAIGNNEEIRHADARVEILHYGPATSDFYRTLLIEGNRCSTSAMTVRKSFIEKHGLRFNTSPEYVIVEDYDFWMRLALHGARYRFIDEVLGEYVLGEEGISRNLEKSRRNWMHLLHDHVFLVQQFEPDRKKLWREIRARAKATDAVADLRLHRPLSFIKNAGYSLFLSPLSLASWLHTRLVRRYSGWRRIV
jgi:glycosyltransferase involved in cell wall biosynthesis